MPSDNRSKPVSHNEFWKWNMHHKACYEELKKGFDDIGKRLDALGDEVAKYLKGK